METVTVCGTPLIRGWARFSKIIKSNYARKVLLKEEK